MAQEPVETFVSLQHRLLTDRDVAAVARLLHPQVVWIDANRLQIYQGAARVCEALREQIVRLPESMGLEIERVEHAVGPNAATVVGRMRLFLQGGKSVCLYVGATLEPCGEAPRFLMIHFSWVDPGDVCAGLDQLLAQRTEALSKRDRDLKALSDNIPGGVLQCRNDDRYTIVAVSDSFVKLFGYSRRELEERFHNAFLEMIHPEDRDRVFTQVHRDLATNKPMENQYRVLCRDGRELWVLEKSQLVAQTDVIYCILVDITESQQALEQLRLSMERYQIILNQSNDSIFDYDLRQDTLKVSANWNRFFGYMPPQKRVSAALAQSERIHPQDREAFLEQLAQAQGGAPTLDFQTRLLAADGIYRWCQIRATVQFGQDHLPLRVVGSIIDIDGQKRMQQELELRAQRDALTGLYNKGTVQEIIDQRLTRTPKGRLDALMIVDIDDFKVVNDSLGHLFGDAFLADVARTLRGLFRAQDLVGRVGGDEFLVYMSDLPDERAVHTKARQLLAAFARVLEDQKHDYRVSCSVGVALYPMHGTDLRQLFSHADEALYQAKHLGKNRYEIYGHALPQTQAHPAPAAEERPVARRSMSEQLISYVFENLYEASNLDAAIQQAMATIGSAMDVSRVYVFENEPDPNYCSNTYEWCGPDVSPQIDLLQHLSYTEDIDNYAENFRRSDIFYCRDVTTMAPDSAELLIRQGIKSMLHCAIRDHGVFRGFVGFDECRLNHLWTQEQVDTLATFAKVLGVFLFRERAQQALTDQRT